MGVKSKEVNVNLLISDNSEQVNLSFIAGLKFIYYLYANHRELVLFLNQNKLFVNLYLGVDEFVDGYVGSDYRIENMLFSSEVRQTEMIAAKWGNQTNNLFMSGRFYEKVEDYFKKYIYPAFLTVNKDVIREYKRLYVFPDKIPREKMLFGLEDIDTEQIHKFRSEILDILVQKGSAIGLISFEDAVTTMLQHSSPSARSFMISGFVALRGEEYGTALQVLEDSVEILKQTESEEEKVLNMYEQLLQNLQQNRPFWVEI